MRAGALTLIAAVALASCSSTRWMARFRTPTEYHSVDADEDSPFLKAHARAGDVYVFDEWEIDWTRRTVGGHGMRYDLERDRVASGQLTVALDDVVLFETNRPESVRHSGVVVMAVVTGVSLAITIACLNNPKACFGSCPTFYVLDEQNEPQLVAEGFSSSVARVLEATDVDALSITAQSSTTVEVVMKNEALETHAIRSLRLHALPQPDDGRVVRAGDSYRVVREQREPDSCSGAAADCHDAISRADGVEYRSATDSENLATRELVELEFPAREGRQGLVIRARNTLLNTFLFYQVLAWMGLSAGEWFIKLERGGSEGVEAFSKIGRLLGGIDVEIWHGPDAGWRAAGVFDEVGPIAHDTQLVELPDRPPAMHAEPVRVRLRMTRGNWRLDQVAAVTLGENVEPVVLEPTWVGRGEPWSADERPDGTAKDRLLDGQAHLVTFPGDQYRVAFSLPAGPQRWTLFLESTGYYYEWIRRAWLEEDDQQQVLEVVRNPEKVLRDLAPEYKAVEAELDAVFWRSRIGRDRR